jgi:Glycosyl transferase family 2
MTAALSIVVADNGTPGSVERFLAALEPQLDADVEVIVERPPAGGEALVPLLWRDGIDRATGEIVALTISPMVPAPDWVATLRTEHETRDAVAGAIDPGDDLRLSDWAEFFARYAKDMTPFEAHATVDLPGDNASYKRSLLERTHDLYRDGFWEPVVHRRLDEEGVELWQTPALVVRQGRSAGPAAFASQRLHHGRAHGSQRGAHMSPLRNLAGVLGAPMVPPLLLARRVQAALARRRHVAQLLLSIPWMLVYDVAWALGEARGHLDALAGRSSEEPRSFPPPRADGKPWLSVVVASVNGFPYLAECLSGLKRNAPGAEVVVADWTDARTRETVRRAWPGVKLLSFDEPMAVPELRAAGIAAASAPYVAVIEDHCVVRPGWAQAIVADHEAGHDVVGGPVRNAALRTRDWAAFFVEYADFMEPMPSGTVPGLTGMNVSYDRRAIESMQPLLDEGRWESWLHPHLADEGFEFWADPDVVLDHVMRFDVGFFLSQRWHYARSHAGARNAELGLKGRLVYFFGAPLIVPLMYLRTARAVAGRPLRVPRFLLASPLIVLYLATWAAGEAAGYALGGGRSLLKVR